MDVAALQQPRSMQFAQLRDVYANMLARGTFLMLIPKYSYSLRRLRHQRLQNTWTSSRSMANSLLSRQSTIITISWQIVCTFVSNSFPLNVTVSSSRLAG